MLISAVVSLKALKDADPVPRGRAVHAWFLKLIERHDPTLAAYLHQGVDGVRPFTVSDVRWRLDGYSSKGLSIHGGRRYLVRITSVMPELSEVLESKVLGNLPSRLELAGALFEVAGATTNATTHPWAGSSSRRDLWQKMKSPRPAHLSLQFTSPTTFRSRGVFVPLPWPRMVFNGLIKKWNLFAEAPFPRNVLQVIDDALVIRGYHLQSTGVPLGRKAGTNVPAFWGRCDYAVVSRDEHLQRLVYALAAFAFYAGVGRETTRGFGQCRLTSL